MDAVTIAAAGLFAVSAGAVLLFFVVYPAVTWLAASLRSEQRPPESDAVPSVTVLVVVRNAESFIAEKVRNTLDLDYPPDRLDAVFYSDGSTDGTNRIIHSAESPRLRLLVGGTHQGKTTCLNEALPACEGEIVVFSDADAFLAPDAIGMMTRHFADPTVGGVCGQRVIGGDQSDLREAQASYISFDSAIKRFETRLGSVTSNDGKIYAVRRPLLQPFAPAVADDPYAAYNVVRQGSRFIFEPAARAFIRVPSRSPSHEIVRRRRIVSQSLRGIYLLRATLNPFRYGWFSVGLAVNKVLRRLLPVFLVTLFLSSFALSFRYPAFALFTGVQWAFYTLAALHPQLRSDAIPKLLRRGSATAFYFVVGQYGTLLGLLDFLLGRSPARWEPVKTDVQAG